MSNLEDLGLPHLTPEGGPPCPRCDEPLVLIVEPAVAEFYCPRGHEVQIESVLKEQAAAAKRSLREALKRWEARQEELVRQSAEAQAAGQTATVALCRRRLLVIAERLHTIQTVLAKRA